MNNPGAPLLRLAKYIYYVCKVCMYETNGDLIIFLFLAQYYGEY